MKILILEDEHIAGDFLSKMITDHFEDCSIVGIARTVDEAVLKWKLTHPDVLFMDINLGNHLSFEIFEQIDPWRLNVVFTTSYQEFALKAFKVHAIDYVMKPVNIADLSLAIEKARERVRLRSDHAAQESFENTSDVMLIWENAKLSPIEISNIIKIKSHRNYSSIFLVGNKRILTSKNLGAYETLLVNKGFFRIHKSCIVNIRHFVSYHAGIKARVKLSDDEYEPISRRKKDELVDYLNKEKRGFV